MLSPVTNTALSTRCSLKGIRSGRSGSAGKLRSTRVPAALPSVCQRSKDRVESFLVKNRPKLPTVKNSWHGVRFDQLPIFFTDVVPLAVPSLRHSEYPPTPSSAQKSNVPFNTPIGARNASLGTMELGTPG